MKRIFLVTGLIVAFAVVGLMLSGSKNNVKVNNFVSQNRRVAQAGAIQIPFIKNEGQVANPDILFYAPTFVGTVSLTDNGLVYVLPGEDNQSVFVQESFIGGEKLNPVGREKAETAVSYFIGNNPDKWRSGVSSYNAVSLGDIWDGVELLVRAHGDNVEKVFTVAPGADPTQIEMLLSEDLALWIDEKGELIVSTKLGEFSLTAPVAYQEDELGNREEVFVDYVLTSEQSYGFVLGEYDHTRQLVIDPLLASTYLGGAGSEFMNGGPNIYLASDNSIFVSGIVTGSGFPTTSGAYDETYNTGWDGFVAKLSNDLTTLSAATFIGTTVDDFAGGLALDSSGNVFVAMNVATGTFPVTAGAYDESFNGTTDVAIVKLTNDLTTLSSSTFLGGSLADATVGDMMARLYVDASDNIFVTGATFSTDFPTTGGVFDTSHNGDRDLFVSKLDNSLSSLLASTYVGGSAHEYKSHLAFDGSSNVFLFAEVNSSNFPTSSIGYDNTYAGTDMVIMKFNNTLTTLAGATYYATSGIQQPGDIYIDSSGVVYVSGGSRGAGMATTGAYDEVYNGGGSTDECVVGKFSNDLTSLIASTYFGGGTFCLDIKVDALGFIYVVGGGGSSVPVTGDAYQGTFGGGGADFFVTRFESDLATLNYSSYLGGSGTDRNPGMELDSSKNVYVYGELTSTNFPTTTGVYQGTFGGSFDTSISKLSLPSAGNTAPTATYATQPSQVAGSRDVSMVVTVADTDSNVTSLTVQHSTNGSSWSSSTLGTITATEGSVATTTGSITSIDTDNDGSVGLTITWLAGTDLDDTDDASVFVRVTPNDGTENGATATSSAFALDTVDPTAPGSLSGATASETSVTFTLPTTTSTDTNFSDYRIYYGTSTPVTTSMTAYTSSSDANLGAVSFNGATTTTVTGLSADTTYYFNIFAFDDFDNTGQGATEATSTTLAAQPTAFAGSATSGTDISFSWSGSATSFTIQDIVGNGTFVATVSPASFGGLRCGTTYSFRIKAINSDGAESAYTDAISVQTLACPGGGGFGGSFYSSVGSSVGSSFVPYIPPVVVTPPSTPPPITPPPLFSAPAQIASTGSQVKVLQEVLNALGFKLASVGPGSPGNETDYFGPLTQEALQKFQETFADEIGAHEPGVLDEPTQRVLAQKKQATLGSSALPVFMNPISLGVSGNDVRALQQLLNKLGFGVASTGPGSPGNETNYFGSLTRAAVIRLQLQYGIIPSADVSVAGLVGPQTRALLNSLR